MDLETLARRLDHERGGDRDTEEVMVLSPGGELLDVLSLNWDSAERCWVIVAEER